MSSNIVNINKKKCLICNKNQRYPICWKCKKNPFKVEKCRQILAERNELAELKKMYLSSYAEIQDINSADFWNKKLNDIHLLSKQDGMTKDRIKTAFNFIPKSAKKILDVGAGYGYIEEIIFKRTKIKLFGNDISSEAIKNLRKRFKGRFIVESVYEMKYKENYFDVVLALEVLEHVPPSRIFKVLQSIYRILKKNGIFILSVPMNEGLEFMNSNPNGHVRDYTIKLISSELEILGFKVLEYKVLFAFKRLYKFKKILSKIFTNRWSPNNVVIKAQKI
jgi:ubiquinone/menaquinone biosynthesis C-methylase UbiE